jgi:hypothetical protein
MIVNGDFLKRGLVLVWRVSYVGGSGWVRLGSARSGTARLGTAREPMARMDGIAVMDDHLFLLGADAMTDEDEFEDAEARWVEAIRAAMDALDNLLEMHHSPDDYGGTEVDILHAHVDGIEDDLGSERRSYLFTEMCSGVVWTWYRASRPKK